MGLLYKPYKAGMPWQFAGSFYYATTVLTTIGITFELNTKYFIKKSGKFHLLKPSLTEVASNKI